MEQNEQPLAKENFRPNWLAIAAVLIGLIAVGFLLGKLMGAPDGLTLDCPMEDMVEIVGAGDHVIVYCEDYRK